MAVCAVSSEGPRQETGMSQQLPTQAVAPKPTANGYIRYLLIREGTWAKGKRQCNWYLLGKDIEFPFDGGSNMFDIVSKDGITGGVSYGTFDVRRVKLLKITDSLSTKESSSDAVYFLSYPRDSDHQVAARKFAIESNAAGGRIIRFVDYNTGATCTLELSPRRSRPVSIYQIEVLSPNVLQEVWREKRGH